MRSITSRAALARGVGLDQMALDGGGREPLVPEGDRHRDMGREIAREGARRLRARAFRAIEIEGEAYDEGADLVRADRVLDGLHVGGELDAADRVVRRGDRARHVGQRKPDRLGADVEAEQPRIAREQLWQVFYRDERC